MLEVQNTTQENYLIDEKNLIAGNEKVIFEPGELKFFVEEVKEMIGNNEIIDLPKAIHNAKYFSMLEKRIANVEAGHYVEHDLIEDDDDE